ncbi:MAG: phage terminase large subunit [Gemmataceae bacterium]|nr:phage terminase large subunit [Gemmataceae bacterium]
MTIRLTRPQYEFRTAPHIIRGFVGGVGSGKSWVGAYDLIRRAKKDRLYMVLAPTYTLLEDSSLRSFRSIAELLGVWNPQSCRMSPRPYCRLHTGAEFIFRSADEPDRLRGPNLSGVWHDEASLCDEAAFEMAIARLREAGELGRYSATFTPRGKKHWTYKVFVENQDADTILISATTRSNMFNDPKYVEMVGKKYSSRMRAQELEGQFLDEPGQIFRREWFRLVDAGPASGQRVRYWDRAATQGGGCYTVGVLMCRGFDGYFYVEDVVRQQLSTYARDQLILQTAQLDKAKYGYVPQWFEQEPGSAGVDACHATARLLTGFAVQFDKVTGSKIERAQPFEAQCEAGNVIVLNRNWTGPYLDELCEFPNGQNADQVDASAGAFVKLAAMHTPTSVLPITIPEQQIEVPQLDMGIFG